MARNLYAGYCYVCGAYVPPGYGHFERQHGKSGPKWKIKCVKCASGRIVTDDDPCVKAVKKRLEAEQSRMSASRKMDGGAKNA